MRRYLMVTCNICNGIRQADRPCHYCGSIDDGEGHIYNRRTLTPMAVASGHKSISAAIRKAAYKLGLVSGRYDGVAHRIEAA